MISEATTTCGEASNVQAPEQTVYVLMSDGEGGVAGMVCATRQRAEAELRDILSEYVSYDDGSARPTYDQDAIEALIIESRQASINPHKDYWYWIDECPVHT